MNSFQCDPTKLIIICGAGISNDSPTCLPVGNSLAEFYVNNTCIKGTYAMLENYTKQISSIIGHSEPKPPRLETIS